MGLCKCPKRKVTNLFCFEHRVNVCENCLVSSHESCVVQTYLSWLTDSDYDSNCSLCTELLNSKETGGYRRGKRKLPNDLTKGGFPLDHYATKKPAVGNVFHWSCLSQRAGKLPNTTAPAGYKCPSCLDVIFPAVNQTSPVIDQLREKLSKVQWAAAGLNVQLSGSYSNGIRSASPSVNGGPPYSTVNVEESADFDAGDTFTARSKLSSSGGEPSNVVQSFSSSIVRLPENDDSPSAKYARRTNERRSIQFQCARLPRSVTRLILAVIILLALYYFVWSGGGERSPADAPHSADVENSMFDPHANPNIHIQSRK